MKAVVTPRMKPLVVDGQEVTVVWMPYNWGFKGLSKGPSVNHLTIDAVDPGAGTQETKACLVNVVKVEDRSRSRGFGRGGRSRDAGEGRQADTSKVRTTLIDIGKCIGCRACQVACKQWNEQGGRGHGIRGRARLPEPGRRSARRRTR